MASNLRERAAALPKMPEPIKGRADKLPYLQSQGKCIDCGGQVCGDWGLVPDRCALCDESALRRHAERTSEALRAQRDLLVEALDTVLDDISKYDSTAGYVVISTTPEKVEDLRAVLDAVRGKRG